MKRRRPLDDLDDDIRDHIERETQDNVDRGMTPDDARAAAYRKFGNVTLIKEDTRAVWVPVWFDQLLQDARYAVRMVARSPGFSAVVILTLALGIGLNTGIFGLIDALLLRTLPVRNPHQLIALTRIQGGQSGDSFSYPQVRYLAEQSEIFLSLCGFSSDQFNVGPPEALEPTSGAWVSAGYYETLGLVPVAGRLLARDDDQPGAPPAAVITDNYWARRFQRDPSAIGRPLLIEGVPVTIVGVSPPGFAGAIVGNAADITVALSVLPQLKPERKSMIGVGGRWLKILARPREGLSEPQLKARLGIAWAQYLSTTVSPQMSPAARARALSPTLDLKAGATGPSPVRSQFRQPLLVLMGVVGLVLVIACVNVANLLLARAAARQREVALRLALGASRARVVRQLLTESASLAIAGGGLGIAFALFGSGVLVKLLFSGGPDASEAIALDVGPSWRLLAFTSLVTVTTTLFFGLVPAIRATVAEPNPTMSGSPNRVTGSRSRLASALVAAQVAISLLLLIGAGLFVQTLRNLRTLDRGFRHEGVLLVHVDAKRAGYEGARLRAFNRQLLAIAERLPGVTAASLSSITPLMGGGISMPIAINGQPIPSGEMHFNFVAPRYFETLGTPILLGRDFTFRDDEAAPGVAIVNEAFVRQYMPNGRPLDQRVSVVGSPRELQVVGVVKDAVYEGLRQTPPPTVYAAHFQGGTGAVTLEIYGDGSLVEAASAIRAEVQPKLAGKLVRIQTLTSQLESSLVQERLMATLASAFGGLALALAAVGLYGVLAYIVVRRTNEIGIRLALGAQRSQVLGLVMRDVTRMLALGTAFGLPSTWAASRLVSSMLFGVATNDSATIVLAITLLMLTGLLAGYLPARRATKVDPLVALRHE